MRLFLKVNPAFLLSGEKIKINKSLFVYQPTVRDQAYLGDEEFGSIISVWTLSRKDIVPKETDETWNLDDWDVYKQFLCYNPLAQKTFKDSVMFFIHKKVEFLKMGNSIFIGELESGIELTQELFSEIQSVIKLITSQKEENKKIENAPRSKKGETIHKKIVEGEKRVKELKEKKGEDPLSSQIVSAVAHGYSYDFIYDLTLIQFRALLEKLVQIENYNITAMLSPYIDKKNKGKNKHWLE